MARRKLSLTCAAVLLLVIVTPAGAGIRANLLGDAVVEFETTMDMPFMTVGNLGNAGELSGEGAGGWGPDRICGAVDYEYKIGKFEVTVGQYAEFLNAVGATDTYDLYSTNMSSMIYGCNIERTGASGSYSYSAVAHGAEWEDRPVNYVSWGDAARFCNWLTNGMPTGAQDLTTTEDGAYLLNGAMDDALATVVRRSPVGGSRYYIPTEDEWYKAAYHKNDGDTGNYFIYPTSNDTLPSNELIDPDPGNNANFVLSGSGSGSIGSPYYRTEAGDFENSPSPYGAFDMGGNVWEWNEAIYPATISSYRGVRGASFNYSHANSGSYLRASTRMSNYPTDQLSWIGFRVAELPEPATVALFGIAGLALLARRKG